MIMNLFYLGILKIMIILWVGGGGLTVLLDIKWWVKFQIYTLWYHVYGIKWNETEFYLIWIIVRFYLFI